MISAQCWALYGIIDGEKLISLAYDETTGGTDFVVVNRVKIFRRYGVSRLVQIDLEGIFGANGKKYREYPFL
jgi:hypothetical protein